MPVTLKYNVNLPTSITDILSADFWIYNNVPGEIASYSTEPMKFTSSTYILLRRGSCTFDINLRSYELSAPAYINVNANSYLHVHKASEDFEAGVVVISPSFADNISVFFRARRINVDLFESQVLTLTPELYSRFSSLFTNLQNLYNDVANPDRYSAILYYIVSFFFANSYRLRATRQSDDHVSPAKRITDRFLELAQKHFKSEHNLDFYAEQIKVTGKHLSRNVKEVTGYSASQWIDRFLMLEAKVMLKSSTLNISEIADELHFATQSAFGKFFRKNTGMSPKVFRKSSDGHL